MPVRHCYVYVFTAAAPTHQRPGLDHPVRPVQGATVGLMMRLRITGRENNPRGEV
jgi:hypothetical protein